MKARFYDPLIGRFYSADPVGFQSNNPISFNRYAYANNNPYSFVDPDGRDGVNVGLSMFYKGIGISNSISIRFPGVTSEPFDIQLKVVPSSGPASFILKWFYPDNPFVTSAAGFDHVKGTLDIGYDYGSSEGSGVSINHSSYVGYALLGLTSTVQDVDVSGNPIPSGYALHIGPQVGYASGLEVEFTTSGSDVLNLFNDAYNVLMDDISYIPGLIGVGDSL